MAEENKTEIVEEETVEKTEPTVDFEAEYTRLKAENEKLRQANTNASSDAASWKKKYRETQSEQERIKAERDEEFATMRAENEAYKKREQTLGYVNKLMECGYDAETAQTMANSLPDGIGDSFFAEQKKFVATTRATERANALNNQPNITAGGTVTSKQIVDKDVDAFRRGALGIY